MYFSDILKLRFSKHTLEQSPGRGNRRGRVEETALVQVFMGTGTSVYDTG